MSFGARKAPTGCNFVHNDEIWKDHVRRELQTSRKWPDKWGFLAQKGQGIKPGYSNAGSSVKLPALNEEREKVEDINSLVEMLDQALDDSRSGAEKRDYNYPQTTAGEIGWRSADFSSLERFGRHARGQQGIRHQLQWPREAVY